MDVQVSEDGIECRNQHMRTVMEENRRSPKSDVAAGGKKEAVQSGAGDVTQTEAFPEFEVLLALADAAASASPAAPPREISTKGVDWEAVEYLAQYHRVAPLIAQRVDSASSEIVPGDVRDRFEQLSRMTRIHNRFLLGEMGRLLDRLDEEGIPALPFKGPLLAQTAYGDLRSRRSVDIDLLVPKSAFPSVIQCLKTAGYEPHTPRSHSFRGRLTRWMDGQAKFTRKGAVFNVDVHTRIMPPLYTYDPAFQALWQRSTTVSVADDQFPYIGALDGLIMLCYQGIKNRWERLKYLCDIAALIEGRRELDWTDALPLARRVNAEQALCLGVTLAHTMLGSQCPPVIEQEMQRKERLKDIAARVTRRLPRQVETGTMGWQERIRFHLATQDTFGARARYASMSVFRHLIAPLAQ